MRRSYCLRYVEDFAKHKEAIYSGDDQETQSQLDRQRTGTHNEMITSVDAYYNWLVEKKDQGYDTDWKYWSTYSEENKGQTRVMYGKFAVALTLNRFKAQLTEIKQLHASSGDLEAIKETYRENAEILAVIQYIEILSKVLEEDRLASEPEIIELEQIQQKLQKTEEEILIIFNNLYKKDYES